MCANFGKSWSGNPESWRAHQFVKMRVVANSFQAQSLRKCTTDTAFSEMVRNVNSTPTKTARTELHSMITFHHANTRGSRGGRLRVAHLCVSKTIVIHVSCLLPCRRSTSSLTYLTYLSDDLPTLTRPSVHDPHLPCDVPRQSGGSTPIPSLTGCEPELIETEAIEPEDLEPRKIELDRNLGTDPYQRQERFMRNSITEDMDEFGKVGAEMSYIQSQMHSDKTQKRALQNLILKMENYEKCWLHHCICKVERTVNHLEYQLHR